MSEKNDLVAPVVAERLRQMHLKDAPLPSQRERLLGQIRHATADKSDHSDPAPIRVSPDTQGRLGSLLPWAFALAAAAAGAMVIGRQAAWFAPAATLHPELRVADTQPPGASSPDVLGQAKQSARLTPEPQPNPPCTRAEGQAGALAAFASKFRNSAPATQPQALASPSLLIPEQDGRSGEWFHWRSTQEAQSLAAPLEVLPIGRGASVTKFALKVAGPPPVGWGANAGVRFRHCYDASRYAGLEFRVHGLGAIFVHFQTLDTVPTELGGRCTERCWVTGGRVVVLSRRAQTQRILWNDVSRDYPRGVVATELMQIMFSVQSGVAPYEFWVDSLKFLEQPEPG